MLRGDEPDTLDPRESPARAVGYTGTLRSAWSIRTRDWSYLHHLRPRGRNATTTPVPGTRELFRRTGDLREQHNRAEAEPRIADELELRLRRFVANLS